MLPRRRSILRIWKGCGMSISGPTSRTGRMSTWLPGRNATAPSRSTVKPPLTRPKMRPSTRLPSPNSLSSLSHAASRRARSRLSIASPSAFSMRSTNTSTSEPTWRPCSSSLRMNSLRSTRPSLFRPTSMCAMPFSMAVTVPLTTRPSKPPSSAAPSCSSSIAAKSSRVGLAVVAMFSVVLRIVLLPAAGLPGVFTRLPAPLRAVRGKRAVTSHAPDAPAKVLRYLWCRERPGP